MLPFLLYFACLLSVSFIASVLIIGGLEDAGVETEQELQDMGHLHYVKRLNFLRALRKPFHLIIGTLLGAIATIICFPDFGKVEPIAATILPFAGGLTGYALGNLKDKLSS